jgi:hypothetical protein
MDVKSSSLVLNCCLLSLFPFSFFHFFCCFMFIAFPLLLGDPLLAFPCLRVMYCQVPVAHLCNPGYSGDRDQKGLSSKPAWANSSQDPIEKKKFTKKGWWSDSRCTP